VLAAHYGFTDEELDFSPSTKLWAGPSMKLRAGNYEIKHLMDNGVTVHMFDRDLQELIHEENKDFLAQALERAAAAKEEKPQKVTLSTLEGAFALAVTEDFSTEALEATERLPRSKTKQIPLHSTVVSFNKGF